MEATSETRAGGAASWAGQALMVTAVIAVVAKLVGVLLALGLHGVVSQPVIETFVERTTRLSTVAALTSVVNDTAHFLRVQARN